MNTELIKRIDNLLALKWEQSPDQLLRDCKAEIEQLNAELAKAREYVPFDMDEIGNVIINHAPLYRSDIDWFKAIEQAIIQRANLVVKE